MKKIAVISLGFTLIELLVSISIGLLLASGGLAAYRGMGNKQAIKLAGSEFKTNLKLFQQKALSGEKPVGCIELQGYEVNYVSSSSYSVQAICSVGSGVMTVFNFDNGVEFLTDFDKIEFSTIKTSIAGASQVISLSTSESSYEYQVKVSESGVISEEML